ncbi:MAG: heme o synthase [Planctomycetota bacterium]
MSTGPSEYAGELRERAAAALSVFRLRDRLRDYQMLVKPKITRLVVVTAAIGFVLAWRQGHAWTWLMLVGTLAGTAMSCMAASVFNQVIERRTDAKMPRTADRPMAAGRVPTAEAWALGGALLLLGQAALCMFGTPLASALAAFTVATYALVYTPMKRWSPAALYVGAIPGAMPPLIGYTAVTGELFTQAALAAWVVFAVMAVWQVPHFLAIGVMYRDDYAAAGLAMHAVRDPSGASSRRNTVIGCVVLLAAGALPTWLGFAGWIALAVASVGGLVFLAFALRWVWAVRGEGVGYAVERRWARRVFFASLIYLPVVLAAIVVDAR